MHIAVDIAIRLSGGVNQFAVAAVGEFDARLVCETPDGHKCPFRQAVGEVGIITSLSFGVTLPGNQRLWALGVCDKAVNEAAVLLLCDFFTFGAGDGQGALVGCCHSDFSFCV